MAKTERQVTSVWCPACGIPRTATVPLKSYLAKKKKVKFYCSACGFLAEFSVPSKKKGEAEDDKLPSLKDVTKMISTAKTVGRFL